MSTDTLSSTFQPEELSRRISEIDLSNLRRRTGTITSETAPPAKTVLEASLRRYSSDQLLALAPEGTNTPALPVPPSTPIELPSASPAPGAEKVTNVTGEAPPEVKKKKKKSSGRNRKAAPTGFEEYYADAPTTPNEHAEERDLYDRTVPLSTRIVSCLMRYRQKRNLDSSRANILTKYLMLGGVEASSNKEFTGGLDNDTLENTTSEEIAAIKATDTICSNTKNEKYYDPARPDGWVVDFTGVAKGFLSWTAPNRLGMDHEKVIDQTCAVIRNFLNYLLLHAVCPEYTEDILGARDVCDMAQTELWSIANLRCLLPGDFNVAASTLHPGAEYYGLHIGAQEWAKGDPLYEDVITSSPGMSDQQAHHVFRAALAYAGDEKLFMEFKKGESTIVKSETRAFEVVSIERASFTLKDEFSKILDHNGHPGHIKPLGLVQVKAWEGPGIDNEDVSDDEDESKDFYTLASETQTFWVEDDTLSHFFVGLKLEVIVHELSIGLKFFDKIVGLYCSFHTILPNERVIENWKEPVANTRPPPTEANPEAEESAELAQDVKDFEKDDKVFAIPKADEKSDKKNDSKVDKNNPKKVAEKAAEKASENGAERTTGSDKLELNIGVGIKVKKPKAKAVGAQVDENIEPETDQPVNMGPMESGGDGGLYSVGKGPLSNNL